MNINGKVKNYPHIQTKFLQQLLEVMKKTTKEVDNSIARRNILKGRANQIVRARKYTRYKDFSDRDIAERLGITPFNSVKKYIEPRSWEEEMKFAIENTRNYHQENNRIGKLYNLVKNQAKNGEELKESNIKKTIRNIIRTSNLKQETRLLMNLLKQTSKRS